MARYILLSSWTDQGIRNIKDSPKRLDAARELGKKNGIDIREFHMVMGKYDMVLSVDAPDDETLAKYTLTLAMGGNIRTVTLKAFPEESYRKVISSV